MKNENSTPMLSQEKRLLDLDEFCRYTSLGRNQARKLMEESGCVRHFGRRILVDRVCFDRWCDEAWR